MLKKATREYIEANKESISSGILNPIDIGVDISGYRIGIRKDSDGTVSAMIASAAGGNDLRAAKVASLLGVSAGIYSAQNTEKAWGINGVWAEDISNYGFTSLPTGIPVITTAYDKGDASGLNEEQLKDFIENSAFDKVTAQQFCIDNPDLPENERCITDWNIIGINPLEVIAQCNAGTQSACEKGYDKHINRSCSEISLKYKGAGFNAPSGIYKLTTSKTTQVEKACYFVNGELPMAEQLITGAKTDAIARRYDWENGKISTTCATIINNWNGAPTAFYSHVTGINTYNANQPCVFPDTPLATITQCNTVTASSAMNTDIACRFGYVRGYNTSCTAITDTSPAYTARRGQTNSITSSAGGSRECCNCGIPCANIGWVSDGVCKDVNGWGWIRSNNSMNYENAASYCSGKGMTLKSLAQIKASGLWNTGSNPFNGNNWYWTTDNHANTWDYRLLVALDDPVIAVNYQNWSLYDGLWGDEYRIYALCGAI